MRQIYYLFFFPVIYFHSQHLRSILQSIHKGERQQPQDKLAPDTNGMEYNQTRQQYQTPKNN